MNNNIEIIKNALNSAFISQTPQGTKLYFQTIINTLDNYLTALNSFYDNLEIQSRPLIQQYEAVDASTTTISYAIFKKLSYSEAEIDELLKTGYRLIDELRYFFTNEKIVYQIGIPYRGKLYEKQISLDELLKYTRVEYNTKSKIDNLLKLRMYNKSGLRKTFNMKESAVLSKADETHHVYSKIWSYIHNDSPKGQHINLGNAYEVYRVLVGRRGTNKIPPRLSVETIERTFEEVRKNIASSVKGGDFLNKQIKYFASAPSLVTTETIRTTLTEIRDIFEEFVTTSNTQELTLSLQSLFLKDPLVDKAANDIEQESLDKTYDYLTQLISKLDIK